MKTTPANPAVLIALAATAAVAAAVAAGDRIEPAGESIPQTGTIELVESVPIETDLDLPRLRNAGDVWLEMVAGARSCLDIETFYFSGRPDGPGRLAPVIEAVAAAAGRGVKIRAMADIGFIETYPQIPRRLSEMPGAEYRSLDGRSLWGGVLHAKCFAVDGESFFLGSQNWDWRALEHIRELGVKVRHPGLTQKLLSIVDLDWALAAGQPPPVALSAGDGDREPGAFTLTGAGGDSVTAVLAASPPQALPDGVLWDEPLLVAMMDAATESLSLQLLSYNPVSREGAYYEVLDTALRRAAARGVRVRVILSNWSKRSYMLPHIQSLAAVPGIEIRFTNIPEWSGGFIPYARVEHAKYLLADRMHCWIGTANWSESYFRQSRNISLFLTGRGIAADVAAFFQRSWDSRYAEVVDPCGRYEPPRIGR